MITASELYEKLFAMYGAPRWWSDVPYQVMVQSILVQNTSWTSVEKVTESMAEKLNPESIMKLDVAELENMIRPCGFCKGKAATIRRLTAWYLQYNYSADALIDKDKSELRKELLSIKGIGAETADVIQIYAFHKPSFVIDAYTRRLLARLGFGFNSDDEMHSFFEQNIAQDYQLYGWYHWLILDHGINRCKKVPVCDGCLLSDICTSPHL